MAKYLVTGGAGFIGSHLVDHLLEKGNKVVILDCLSYGSNLKNLPADTVVVGGIAPHRVHALPKDRCVLVVGDVADVGLVQELVNECDGTFHLAAQTHVDRSYGDVLPFVSSNVMGSYSVLQAHRSSPGLRLVYVSTDEVYGDIAEGNFSAENDPVSPRNVYSALKAGGDILARTYANVFGLDVVVARPANNYGPRQFKEKLIPKAIDVFMRRKRGEGIPAMTVYGSGDQVRDWLFVKDNVRALWAMMESGSSGKVYNVGAKQFGTVMQVLALVASRCQVNLDENVRYVPDRIMGDKRYALNSQAAHEELGWYPTTTFDKGLLETVIWCQVNMIPATI